MQHCGDLHHRTSGVITAGSYDTASLLITTSNMRPHLQGSSYDLISSITAELPSLSWCDRGATEVGVAAARSNFFASSGSTVLLFHPKIVPEMKVSSRGHAWHLSPSSSCHQSNQKIVSLIAGPTITVVFGVCCTKIHKCISGL